MLYFAYGSNMNSERMSKACKGQKYKALGSYKLNGFRFEYNGHSRTWNGPAGDAIKDNDGYVLGILYEIDKFCKIELDKSEGYSEKRKMSQNTYECIEILITNIDDKEEKRALTYVHIDTKQKAILNCEYKDILIEGAREHGLCEDYIANHLDVKCHESEYNK